MINETIYGMDVRFKIRTIGYGKLFVLNSINGRKIEGEPFYSREEMYAYIKSYKETLQMYKTNKL
jgi:hypothetical protein